MEENKLAALIRPLETLAESKPKLYRMRVALLAVLGYAYLLAIVCFLLGIIAATILYLSVNWIVIKILWIPLVLVGLILRSLWITIPEPDGMELRREQAPALFDLIKEVTTALSGPKIHHVLLSEDFNASIVQIPSFGMFGWLNNYLVVGLPLLRALNPEEFRAVLAHEIGHLSGKHGRFSGWIYRLRQSWVEILTTVHQERHYASFLFVPFIEWYAPYLNAYSFVLARAQERQADQYSVELAGKEVAAVALIRSEAKQRSLMENFWPDFFRQSRDQKKTPLDTFVQMLAGLDQPIGSTNTQKWFSEALRVPTGYEDTHPALSDRLAALGFAKDGTDVGALIDVVLKADEQKQSAESYYLRELPDDFLPSMNRLWRERIAHAWNDNHERIKKSRKRLDELNAQANERSLTIEEEWERVKILSEVEDNNATLPLIKQILREHPEHIGASFALGAILIEQGNAEGVEHLEKAMQLSPATTGEASTLISGYYLDQGNKELAESFRKRASEHFEKEQRQHEQFVNFSTKDRFAPHGLSEESLKELQNQLSKVRGLGAAFLVRKVIADSDDPFYVLAFITAYTWRDGENAQHVGSLIEELTGVSSLPSPIVFVSLDSEHRYLLPKITQVDRAQLFATSEAGVTYVH